MAEKSEISVETGDMTVIIVNVYPPKTPLPASAGICSWTCEAVECIRRLLVPVLAVVDLLKRLWLWT